MKALGHHKVAHFLHGGEGVIFNAEARRVVLTFYLVIASFLVSLIFLLISLFSGIYFWVPAHIIVILVCLFSFWLLCNRKFKTTKLVLIITLNLVTFWSASIDPFDDGAYLFFIPVGISAFVLLDPHNLKTAAMLVGTSTVLFLLSYFDIARYYELPPHSPQYHYIVFLFVYLFSFGLSIICISFLVNLNRLSEDELVHKEKLAKLKNEQLQKANEGLDRLVYSVSHDLRSPLNSILGLINLVEESNDPEELKNYFEMIRERINSQNNYIKQIIDYSMNSRTEVYTEEIELKRLVDEVVDSLRFSADAKGIDFRRQIDDCAILTSDRICLSIVLNNLVGNAIKYHDLSKSHPFIEIGYSKDQNMIYVRDNGTGIRPEHKQKIFDLFYRGSDRSGGSGLGLFIIKQALEKMKAKIEVESVHGEGSRFTVYLNAPLETAELIEAQQIPEESEQSKTN